MTNAFLNCLKNNYYDRFLRKVKGFCIDHRQDLVSDKFYGKNISYVTVEDLIFYFISIADEGEDKIAFDVVLIPEIYAKINLGHGDFETDSTNKLWVVCSCSAKVGKKLENFQISDVSDYSLTRAKEPLDGDLIPFIKKSDFSNCAEKILSTYYPEAMDKAVPIDPKLLAKRMGLSIVESKITKDFSILGQFFFDDGEATFYDQDHNAYYRKNIKANTIVIDPEATYIHSYGEESLTIAHECVHAFFHRKAFNFTRMLNGSLSSIVCSAQTSKTSQSRTLQWIEWQANSIAPYLLTPANNFKNKAYSLCKEKIAIGNFDPLNGVPELIAEIADYYAITKQAARRRLIDIGCEAAIGCLNWVDDHYVPSYLFKKGSLKSGETYTVGFKDVGKSAFACSDQSLLPFILNGGFVFVENHLVIKSEKYIGRGENGPCLTDYARRHLDECAVKFKIKVIDSDHFSEDFAKQCYLCKNANYFKYSILVSDNKSLADSPLAREALENSLKDKCAIEEKIGGKNINQALAAIQEYRGITNKELSFDSHLDDRTIRRYTSGETKKPDKKTLIAFCIALKVRNPVLIETLLRRGGVSWIDNDPEDEALRMILQSQCADSVEEVNAALKNMGFGPLTKE